MIDRMPRRRRGPDAERANRPALASRPRRARAGWLSSLVLGLSLSLVARIAAAGTVAGDHFPALELQDWNGGKVTLTAPQHGILLVEVWASWCTPCREALPALARLAREANRTDLRVALINIDRDRDKAEQHVTAILPDRSGLELLADPDGEAVSRHGLPGMPTLFVVEDGVVRQIHTGFTPTLHDELAEWLKTRRKGH